MFDLLRKCVAYSVDVSKAGLSIMALLLVSLGLIATRAEAQNPMATSIEIKIPTPVSGTAPGPAAPLKYYSNTSITGTVYTKGEGCLPDPSGI